MDDLIVVNRPIQEVFAFMTDQSNARLWKPFVTESRQITDTEIGVGTQFVEGIDVLNRHLVSVVEILEYIPCHWFVYKTRDESVPFSLVARMSFEETPTGTLIRGHVDFQGRGLFWDWLTPLIRLFFKSQSKSFYRFKQVMENPSKE
jgi:polyketide cyclase/dehydrase/lipid transport protein